MYNSKSFTLHCSNRLECLLPARLHCPLVTSLTHGASDLIQLLYKCTYLLTYNIVIINLLQPVVHRGKGATVHSILGPIRGCEPQHCKTLIIFVKSMTHVRETRARKMYVCHTDLQHNISRASLSHQIERVLFRVSFSCEFLVRVSRTSFSCVCHGL